MKRFPFAIMLLLISCSSNDSSKKQSDSSAAQSIHLDELRTNVTENPDSAGLRMRLVTALDSVNQYKDAIAQTDSLIKRDSNNNGLWFTKAQLLENNGDTAEAIHSYIRAIKIYPSPEAQLSLANLLAENRNKDALFICHAIDRTGLGRETDAYCNFIRGVYYARTGSNKQALEMFDKAITDNYTLMEAYMEKGFIFYESKNYQQALQIFSTAIEVKKTYADAWYWKAKCLEVTGKKNDALDNYKQSLALDKQNKEAAEAVKRLSR